MAVKASKSKKAPRRKAGNKLIDNRAEAYAHHLRRQIMSYLTHEGPSSPSGLAKALGEDVNSVGYHTKRLVELGCVELAEIRTSNDRPPIKIYRLTDRYLVDTENWDSLDPAIKESSTGEAAQLFIDDIVTGFRDGDLGIDGRHAFIHQRLAVDEQGLDEAVAIEEDAMRRLDDLQARVAERCKGNQPAITLSALTGCFRLPKR